MDVLEEVVCLKLIYLIWTLALTILASTNLINSLFQIMLKMRLSSILILIQNCQKCRFLVEIIKNFVFGSALSRMPILGKYCHNCRISVKFCENIEFVSKLSKILILCQIYRKCWIWIKTEESVNLSINHSLGIIAPSFSSFHCLQCVYNIVINGNKLLVIEIGRQKIGNPRFQECCFT